MIQPVDDVPVRTSRLIVRVPVLVRHKHYTYSDWMYVQSIAPCHPAPNCVLLLWLLKAAQCRSSNISEVTRSLTAWPCYPFGQGRIASRQLTSSSPPHNSGYHCRLSCLRRVVCCCTVYFTYMYTHFKMCVSSCYVIIVAVLVVVILVYLSWRVPTVIVESHVTTARRLAFHVHEPIHIQCMYLYMYMYVHAM